MALDPNELQDLVEDIKQVAFTASGALYRQHIQPSGTWDYVGTYAMQVIRPSAPGTMAPIAEQTLAFGQVQCSFEPACPMQDEDRVFLDVSTSGQPWQQWYSVIHVQRDSTASPFNSAMLQEIKVP